MNQDQPPKEIRAALRILDRAILELQHSRDDLIRAWSEATSKFIANPPRQKERRGGANARPSNEHPWRNRKINTTLHEDEGTK